MAARYYVKESTGFAFGKIRTEPRTGGGNREITEVLVLDRAYCHRVVWTSLREGMCTSTRVVCPPYAMRPKRLCRKWNAEDRADAA